MFPEIMVPFVGQKGIINAKVFFLNSGVSTNVCETKGFWCHDFHGDGSTAICCCDTPL